MHGMHIPHTHRGHNGHSDKNGGTKSKPWKEAPNRSEEAKNARAFAEMFERISTSPGSFAEFFAMEPLDVQARYFDFMIAMMNQWAGWYEGGTIQPGHGRMFKIAEWAHGVMSK